MADAAAKRESRRLKITQNAEARMNRLLGLASHHDEVSTTMTASEEKQDEEHNEAETHTSPYNLRHRPQKAASTGPVSSRRSLTPTRPTVSPSTKTVTTKQDSEDEISVRQRVQNSPKIFQEQKTAEPQEEIKDSAAVPDKDQHTSVQTSEVEGLNAESLELCKIFGFAITAFLARYILKFGIGLFLVQSIFLPFIAVEAGIMYILHTHLQRISALGLFTFYVTCEVYHNTLYIHVCVILPVEIINQNIKATIKCTDGQQLKFKDIMWFSYGSSCEMNEEMDAEVEKRHIDEIWCRYTHNSFEPWKKAKFLKRNANISANVPKKYTAPVGIKPAKKQDLEALIKKGLIGHEQRAVFENLPLRGRNVDEEDEGDDYV